MEPATANRGLGRTSRTGSKAERCRSWWDGEARLAESVAAVLLGYPASEVRERVTTGELRSREKEGRLSVEAEPCLRVYPARMLGRMRFDDNRRIEDALGLLTEGDSRDLREAAQGSLKSLKVALVCAHS